MAKYEGAAQGFHGEVKATITVENGSIKTLESEHDKLAYIGNLGINRLIKEVEKTGTLEVDTISGATFSTQALLSAAKKAFAVSKGDMSEKDAMDSTLNIEETAEAVDSISGATGSAFKIENNSPVRARVPYNKSIEFEESYDVVIAGSGGAGLSAAVEAARQGLSVVVYEKAGIPGGTTNYSGGVIQAGGTDLQREKYEIEDDNAEKHAALWIRAGEGLVDEALVKDLAEHAAGNLEWLEGMGLEWEKLYGHAHIPYVDEAYHRDRIHQYKGGGGSASGTLLTLALLKAAEEAGAIVVYDTAVTALVQDSGTRKVHGAVIEKGDRGQIIQARRGVVLATASVDHNPALAKDLHPQQFHDLQYSTILSAQTNTGDGILMGMDSGAAISGMGGTIDFDGKTGNATNNKIPTIPLIFVNGAGERFVTEDATYAYQYRAIFQQQTQLASPTYMIFGHNSISEPGSSWTESSLAEDVKNGVVKKAERLEELAEMIAVPAENFVHTVNYWNKTAAEGKDPLYGRIQGIKPLEGPYYAYTNHATNLGSLGGLKINVDTQVLDSHGKVVDGLYAAGLNAGGWIGGYYPGSGTALAGIIHQGRKAGQHLAQKERVQPEKVNSF